MPTSPTAENGHDVTILCLFLIGPVSTCGLQTEPGRARLGLYADFQSEAPAVIQESLREELAAMMAPAGLRVNWRPLSGTNRNEYWNRVATIRFNGRCDASMARVKPPHPWRFGRTHVIDGKVIPYAEIDCDAIHAFLLPVFQAIEERDRTTVFARAVARVLAHELYHILIQTKRHGSEGTARAFYTLGELAGEEFRFQRPEIERLRRSILPAPLKPAVRAAADTCRTSQ